MTEKIIKTNDPIFFAEKARGLNIKFICQKNDSNMSYFFKKFFIEFFDKSPKIDLSFDVLKKENIQYSIKISNLEKIDSILRNIFLKNDFREIITKDSIINYFPFVDSKKSKTSVSFPIAVKSLCSENFCAGINIDNLFLSIYFHFEESLSYEDVIYYLDTWQNGRKRKRLKKNKKVKKI